MLRVPALGKRVRQGRSVVLRVCWRMAQVRLRVGLVGHALVAWALAHLFNLNYY